MYSVLLRLILETRILIAGIPEDGHALTSSEGHVKVTLLYLFMHRTLRTVRL